MKRGRQRERVQLSELLGAEDFGSSICIGGGREVTLCECERIIVYEHDRIMLALREFSVEICGSALELDTYMGERAIIRGRIDSLRLLRGEA